MKKVIKIGVLSLGIIFIGMLAYSKSAKKITPKSEAKRFISFAFLAENNEALNTDVPVRINEENKTITAAVPYGTDITSLVPSTVVSNKVTLTPEGPQNFSNPISYKITDENEMYFDYTVSINLLLPQKEVLIKILTKNPDNTLDWDVNTDIKTWQGVTLNDKGNIIELNLNEKNLKSIPEEIGQLTNLTSLDLSNNQLMCLPSEIEQLANLSWFNLNENKLTNLPAEIGQLTNLTYLYLYLNQLESIPGEIGSLTNLKGLHIGRNQLKSIPKVIGKLTNLTHLRLDKNQLTNIPKEIGLLTKLTRLDLENNQLTSIQQEVCDLNIKNIHLDAGVTCE